MEKRNKQPYISALGHTDEVRKPSHISAKIAAKIKARRRAKVDVTQLCKGIISGNRTALSQSITLIESSAPKHQQMVKEIISHCVTHSGESIRIGITGVPGVGKSTFIESFGKLLAQKGKKVAVLAIDPSSSISGGSILGDKTRMEELVNHPNAFIRPSPAGKSLGGVARKTRESIILCEAAGFDVILIETVGVGQSETAVHSMTDFFLLLKLAGAGDELQGIKRGIIEMADAIIINKADGNNKDAALKAKQEFNRALHLYPPKKSEWKPKVKLASALHHEGIEQVWNMVEEYTRLTTTNLYFQKNRLQQNKQWMFQRIEDRLKERFFSDELVKKELIISLKKLDKNEVSPFEAADYLLGLK